MYIKKVFAAALLAYSVVAGDTSEAHRSFDQIATENGFQFEQHTVTTVDGYILTQYRIPGSGPPVFF
jgi:hypothetical protein